ncbi:unnamed protein product [Rotaria sp. Silwood2]|nr:unnamed protein product [Rotaria sp. Silwood2]
MTTDHICPCELILKIGCNEYDEISTAIASLLRSCSITNQQFVSVERQIQPTTYFGSFTTHSLTSKIPIQCQSLSCVIFLTDEILKKTEKKDFFKSTHIWNFHHKIELLDEYKQIIARQDYDELNRGEHKTVKYKIEFKIHNEINIIEVTSQVFDSDRES